MDIDALGDLIIARADAEKETITALDQLNMQYDGALLDVSSLLKRGWKMSTRRGHFDYDVDRTDGITLRYPVCVKGIAYATVLHLGHLIRRKDPVRPGYMEITRKDMRDCEDSGVGLKSYLRRMVVRKMSLEGKPEDDIELTPPGETIALLRETVRETVVVPALSLREDLEFQTKGFAWHGMKLPGEYDVKWAIYEDILDNRATRHSKYRLMMPVVRTLVLSADAEDQAELNRTVSPLIPVAFMDDARKLEEKMLVVQFMAWFFRKFHGALQTISDEDARTIWMRMAQAAAFIGEPVLACVAYDCYLGVQKAMTPVGYELDRLAEYAKMCLDERPSDVESLKKVLSICESYMPASGACRTKAIADKLRKEVSK